MIDIQLNYVGNVLKELLNNENTGILTNMVLNGAGSTMFSSTDQVDSAQGQMVFESSSDYMLLYLQAD